jgi:hypothetical protein
MQRISYKVMERGPEANRSLGDIPHISSSRKFIYHLHGMTQWKQKSLISESEVNWHKATNKDFG